MNVSGSGGCQGLALFDDVYANQAEVCRTSIARVVRGAARNDESVAGLDLARRLAVNQDLSFAFEDVTDLIPGMRVAAGLAKGPNDNPGDHSLAARNRKIRRLHDRALKGRVLRD